MALTLATFNVKDFFDSPQNRPVLAQKTEEIAAQLTRADADVIALQEVGSEALIEGVLATMPKGRDYRIVFGGADKRGIGNAILSRLPLRESHVHASDSLSFPVFRRGDPPPFPGRLPLRRPVVHVTFEAFGGPVHALSTHWKSKLPKPEEDEAGNDLRVEGFGGGVGRAEADLRSLIARGAEALHLRRLVESLAGSGEVVLLGDLNDTFESIPVRIVRAAGLPHELFGAAQLVPPEARVSTLHRGTPEQIDHVLATAGLHARLVSAHFQNEQLRDHPFSPDEAPTVDSDHALLVARYEAPAS